jgi:hypothetical protein
MTFCIIVTTPDGYSHTAELQQEGLADRFGTPDHLTLAEHAISAATYWDKPTSGLWCRWTVLRLTDTASGWDARDLTGDCVTAYVAAHPDIEASLHEDDPWPLWWSEVCPDLWAARHAVPDDTFTWEVNAPYGRPRGVM